MRRHSALLVGMLLALPPITSTDASTTITEPGWTPPKQVAGYARDVEMAANQRGDLIVVWEEEDEVLSRFKPAGRPWGPFLRVARRGGLLDDALSLNNRGRATLVWFNSRGLQVSDRDRGGTWRRDRNTPLVHRDREGCGDEWFSGSVVVATDGPGSVFVSWQELGCVEGYSLFTHYASRAADGSWSRLHDGGGGGEHHEAFFPRPGRVLMINASNPITVQRGRAGGELGPKRPVGPPVPAEGYIDMAADRNARGDLVVVAKSFPSPAIVTMSKPAGGQWSTPRHAPVTDNTYLDEVDLTDTGLFVATYQRRGKRTTMFAQVGDVDEALVGPPVVVARAIRGSVESALAARGDGSAAVVWTRRNWPDTLSTHAAVRSASGTWAAPVRLAARRTVDDHAFSTPAVITTRGGFSAAYVRNGAHVRRYRLH